MQVVHVPCDAIKPDPHSTGYAPEEIEALAESIRENGLLRPILVSRTDEGFVIVHGVRRWLAARALGHATIVACLVIDVLNRSSGV